MFVFKAVNPEVTGTQKRDISKFQTEKLYSDLLDGSCRNGDAFPSLFTNDNLLCSHDCLASLAVHYYEASSKSSKVITHS